MPAIASRFSALILSCLLSVTAWSAVEQYPVEHFFRLPDRSALTLSSDGRYVAALAPRDGRANIFIVDQVDKKGWWATGERDADIVTYFWKDSSHLVFTLGGVGRDAEDGGGWFSVSRDGREGGVMVPSARMRIGDMVFKSASVLSRLPTEPDAILIAYNDRLEAYPDVYRQKLGRQSRTVVVRNPGKIVKWFAHRGSVRVGLREDQQGLAYTVVYREGDEGNWSELVTNRHGERGWLPAGFSADGKTLYVYSNVGRDTSALYEFDLATKKLGKLIYEDPEYDVGTASVLDSLSDEGTQLLYSGKAEELIGVRYDAAKPKTVWFREPYAGLQKELDAALPGTVNLIAPVAAEGTTDWVIVRAFSDRDPGSFFLLNVKSLEMTQIASAMSWIKPDQMAEIRPISFKARDGRTIRGYLTLPPGREPKKLPLILNPHGGPYGVRDRWRFNSELQFFANRGFAVLQIDYRGSGGYGFDHYMAGKRQVGYDMLADKVDAVKWAHAEGIGDPERTGIYGASYGGYAAMAGVVFHPELFKFGINYVGVVDWVRQIDRLRKFGEPAALAYNFWKYMGGDPVKEREALDKISPVKFVQNLKAPLFIVHGRIDPTVSIDQADVLKAALDRNKIPYRWLVKNDEGHGFRKEENRIELYRAIEDFLRTAMGPGYPGQGSTTNGR